MRIATYIEKSPDQLAQKQLVCHWTRLWKDAGFNPYVFTEGDLHECERIERAIELCGVSGHLFRRWWSLPDSADTLMVEPTIVPNCTPDTLPEWSQVTSFSKGNSSVVGMTHYMSVRRFLKSLPEIPPPFTDIDMLASKMRPSDKTSPVAFVDATRRQGEDGFETAMFHELSVDRMLERRLERIA